MPICQIDGGMSISRGQLSFRHHAFLLYSISGFTNSACHLYRKQTLCEIVRCFTLVLESCQLVIGIAIGDDDDGGADNDDDSGVDDYDVDDGGVDNDDDDDCGVDNDDYGGVGNDYDVDDGGVGNNDDDDGGVDNDDDDDDGGVDDDDWSEGCSLHVVALLDSIWIDKLHRLSLPTGKWAQLPFLGQPATGTRRVAGTTHTQSGRR